MKKTLIFLFALAVAVGMKAESDVLGDSAYIRKQQEHVRKLAEHAHKLQEHSLQLQEQSKHWGDSIRKHFDQLSSDTARWERFVLPPDTVRWERFEFPKKQLERYLSDTARWEQFTLPKGWLDEYGTIDLPKDQKPLIDLSNIKGRWGFEDYYFSGDILHALPRRHGGFYISGWNITSLLPRLSGLLILRSKKKAAEKVLFSRSTQLRNDRRFQPIVRDRGITIYAHRTEDSRLAEVIILLSRAQSSQSEYVYIVQMMGLLRPDDLTNYHQLLSPAPKAQK